MKERRYECQFCGTRFVHEQRYLKHRCKQMIRDEEFRTPTGQAAWSFYQKWMKAHRRIPPKSSAFIKSQYYTSFMRFAKFVKNVQLPDVDMFIWLMKKEDISPTIWTNDQVYVLYLEFMDRKATPNKQAKITIKTLFALADALDCNVGDVFDHLLANEVIQLLRQRRLSPWILLNSGKFKQFFVNKTTTEERIVMESVIRPPYWAQKFKDCPEDVERMKLYVTELSL